jgi:hypothetical protein
MGSDQVSEHTFHNTDRFMRSQGFDLFRLENRVYSARALPARFTYPLPAQTLSGRVFQGEAYYARDPVEAGNTSSSLTTEQLIKLAAVFSAWGQPDSAAEVIVQFAERLGNAIDVEQALDLLAAQIQGGGDEVLPYREYTAEFSRESPRFFPLPPNLDPPEKEIGEPTLWQRIRAARAAYWDWCYAHAVESARVEKPRR